MQPVPFGLGLPGVPQPPAWEFPGNWSVREVLAWVLCFCIVAYVGWVLFLGGLAYGGGSLVWFVYHLGAYLAAHAPTLPWAASSGLR